MPTTPYVVFETNTGASEPMPAQNFSWEFTRGVIPYATSIDVPISFAKTLLQGFINPCTLNISYDVLQGLVQKTITRQIRNIYVLDHVLLSKPHTHIRIADARYAFTGKKITCAYNFTYLDNVKKTALPETFNPQDLRMPFNTIATGRYAAWSIKPNGKPYTVSEVIEKVLTACGITNFAVNIDSMFDYVLENIMYNDTDLSSALNDLLHKGGLSLSVSPDGQLYVFSLYSYVSFGQNQIELLRHKRLLSGNLYNLDKKCIRPSYINVDFEKIYDIVLADIDDYSDYSLYSTSPITVPPSANNLLLTSLKNLTTSYPENGNPAGNRRFIWMINVLPCPFYMKISGKEINIGEWVSFREFFYAIGIPNYINYLCQPGFFSGTLECRLLLHLMSLTGDTNPTLSIRQRAAMIAGMVSEHFRRTYMIDPYYRAHIKELFPYRCSIINTFDKKNAPPLVLKDYCVVGCVRIPSMKNIEDPPDYLKDSINIDASTEGFVVNSFPEAFVHYLTTLTTAAAPAGIAIVDRELFVIKIDIRQPAETTATQVFPYMISPRPPFTAAYAESDLHFLYPSVKHTCAIIISAIFNTALTAGNVYDFNENRFYRIPITSTGVIGTSAPTIKTQYPHYTMRTTREIARFGFSGTAGEPENKGLLEAIAFYVVGCIYNTFVDRYSGVIEYADFDDDVRHAGNIDRIIWSFSSFSTRVVLYESVPYPEIEMFLSQKHIDYLNNHIDRNNTFNPNVKVY